MCPTCGAPVIAKCGDHRVWHWAHRGIRTCDPWWESETEWHREWKNKFPTGWQEIVQTAQSGEKHIADVKTESGMVIEFQHSFLKAEERIARESFYRKMVWVVDGRRRKRDAEKLLNCIGPRIWAKPPFIVHVTNHEECALLRDWNSSPVPVYFDLGIHTQQGVSNFWRRDPISREGRTFLTPVSRDSFLKSHREGLNAEEIFSEGICVIAKNLKQAARLSLSMQPLGFQQYKRKRSRF